MTYNHYFTEMKLLCYEHCMMYAVYVYIFHLTFYVSYPTMRKLHCPSGDVTAQKRKKN